MATQTRPASRKASAVFTTDEEQQNYAELQQYLYLQNLPFTRWVNQQIAAALPFFRTKYGKREGQG